MVFHLTVVLGLICAGVALGEASSAKILEDAANLGEFVRSLSESSKKGKEHCNECIATAITVILKASKALENNENLWVQDPCNVFTNKDKETCNNVIKYVKGSSLNIMDGRKVCIEAGYCSLKHPKPRPNPNGSHPKVRSDNEAKTPKPTTKTPVKAFVGNQTLENNKLQLKTINPQICEDCHIILQKMKTLLKQNWFFPSIIISVCENFPRRPNCYEMVYENKNKIMDLIHNTTNKEICTSIKWCQNEIGYQLCHACQLYLYYNNGLDDDNGRSELHACKYLYGDSKKKCTEVLKAKKEEMFYLMEHNYGIYSNCEALNLCPKLGGA